MLDKHSSHASCCLAFSQLEKKIFRFIISFDWPEVFNWFHAEYLSRAPEDWYLVFYMQYVHPNLRRILISQLCHCSAFP